MKVRIARQVLVVSSALALAAVRLAEGEQQECAVAVTETPQTVMLDYGCYTVGAAIETGVDSDAFGLLCQAGERIRIILDGTSDTCLDPKVDLFGPNGFLETTSCSPGCGIFGPFSCSLVHETTIPASGTYVLLVSDVGLDETGSYTLQVERITPDRPILGIAYNTTASFDLGVSTDQDYFTFFGQAGSLVQVSVSSTSATCLDPNAELVSPSGALVWTEFCSPACGIFGPFDCSFQEMLSLTETGRYTLILRDVGHDETGTGVVSVTCILGCPPVTSLASRNGGTNPPCYRDVLSPAVGGTWCAEVDATTNPGATVTVVLVCAQPFVNPVPTPYGALLVNTATEVRCSLVALAPGEVVGRHSARIPDNMALVGRPFYTQGLSAGPGPRGAVRIELCNALDYVMGY